MLDQQSRQIHCLRLSVTEDCNLHCRYCRPKAPAAPAEPPLSDDEVRRLVQLFSQCGIDTVRLTGGEPLLRPGLPQLAARIKALPGIRKMTLTTNGTLLPPLLPALQEAGLDGINLSLNSLNSDHLRRISHITPTQHAAVKQAFADILASGIPLKLNYVPLRGYNDEDYKQLVRRYVRSYPVRLRFIELMPIGCARELQALSIPNSQLLYQLRLDYPRLSRIPREQSAAFGDGPAVYYTDPDWKGCVGFISAVHNDEMFCVYCNRVRLSASGFLRPCLASEEGADLGAMLHNGATDEQLLTAIQDTILHKPVRNHFHPWEHYDLPQTRGMYRIGG